MRMVNLIIIHISKTNSKIIPTLNSKNPQIVIMSILLITSHKKLNSFILFVYK